jgi:hypothetical protein
VAVDASGNLFIADTYNNRIREVGTNGIITTVAGDGSSGYSGNGGVATNATLSSPQGVAVNAADNPLIVDTSNQRIREVTYDVLLTVAGSGSSGFSGNGGPAIDANLDYPSGVAVDSLGNLFIADTDNNCVRKVNDQGIITTAAGGGEMYGGYSGDGGVATNAALNQPSGVAVDVFGNMFIADTLNRRIRQVRTNGIITTVAGNGGGGYSGDGGPATNATFYTPVGVAVDSSGNLFIADWESGRVRKVAIQGPTFTVNPVNAGAAGYYDVVITGAYGSVTSSVAALAEITITSQPKSQTNVVGGQIILTVTASGAWPPSNYPYLTYQWQFNGANLPGAVGPIYVLNNLAARNAGNYDVVLGSPYGSITSSVAVVTVLLPPQNLTASLVPGPAALFQLSGTPGTTYILQAATNLTPPVAWQPVFTNAADASGNWSFMDTNVSSNPQQFFRALLP